MNNQSQQFDNTAMNIPFQAASIDREDRMGESMHHGVEPAFWGLLASAAIPLVSKAIEAITS